LATSERGVERWETFDLAAITERVVLGHNQEAAHRGIRIDASLLEAPALGDPRLAEILVTNLVKNALRHNTTGGNVNISTDSTPRQSTISVSNTGPMISSDDVERLFQPFQKSGSERIRHTDGEGNGLGLAIVRAAAEAHRANVTAHARPDGGLEIQACFPTTDE
jgi:signal transduction histidine kinase